MEFPDKVTMMDVGPSSASGVSEAKKTSVEILEDLARDYGELDQLKYDVQHTDTGYINRPTEYVCEVSIGEMKDSASACSVQLAKLLAAQKILDKVEKDGYVVLPDYKRVKPVDPNLDPIYLLEYFCRGSGLDLPSYLQSKIKQGGKTVYSYHCFWRDRVTQGKSLNRYVAQAYAAVQMMDQVVMVSRRDRSYPKMNGEQDDYISVAPKRVAEMLTVSPELHDFAPVPESFPVYSQKAVKPGDPDELTCRYGFKRVGKADLSKPQFVVEYSVTFTGHSSGSKSAAENCIATAKIFGEKLAGNVQQQGGSQIAQNTFM